jgi:hypothetical protein
MNILELDSYRLADAVKFHNRLNPRLWDSDETLRPEVRQKLLEIAADFQEFLGVDDLELEDITISGSNAAYSYTPHSDIDLHLVVRQPRMADQVYQELFNAKKYQYNDLHNIRIRGADVELYVQPADETPVSLGEYSIKNNQWLQIPRRKRAKIDHSAATQKYDDLRHRIDQALQDGDSDRISALIDKIKTMRKTGLDQQGEFGVDNIVYKVLRTQGYIQRLYDAQAAARDQELSLREQPQQPVRYGFGEASTPDGVSPSTKMFLSENDTESIVMQFIKDTARRLGIQRMPEIHIHSDPEWSADNHSFGMYVPETHDLYVNLHNRHILDILRTTAHELAHCRQHEIEPLGPNAGDTGSDMENEAHAVAGIIMRDFADAHPEIFDDAPITESSGYIPTEAEKNDPRFVMALTADVRPGATGLNANRMSLETDAQGRPQLLRANGEVRKLAENLRSELATLDSTPSTDQISKQPRPSRGDGRRREINAPLGAESKPTMPRGTVRVDVTDMYDWYKLGKNIANLDQAQASDFGKGPPSTIVSFGDEETEHKYIKNLKRLGLDTTDIDPVDPDQPPGMPRQKVDPTYNVAESDLAESLRREFELLEDEFLGEIKMSPKNLRVEAAKTGALAGMEFEMIVPNVANTEEDLEPDYDEDERVRDIDDCVNFFDDGNYNSSGDIRRLREAMNEAYWEWVTEQVDNDWYNTDRGFEYFRDYLEREAPFDEDDAQEEATNQLQAEYGDDITPEDFKRMLDAIVEEKYEAYVQEQWDEQGSEWENAKEEFMDERRDDYDEGEWLSDQSIRFASDVESNFGYVTWPYYRGNTGGEADIDSVAAEFSDMIGRPVNASSSYHGARREAGHYVVEPDGSLDPDDSDDAGLEFVSPPLPIDELLADLNKVKAWAGSRGCYTNSSTGLHINISVPEYSRDRLDFVKLALLMGDEYVLDQFGRSSNTYAKSALRIVKDKIREAPAKAQELLDRMRGHMDDLASKAIHSGITSKYTSINTKDGYIEFRSPGGDWLDENFDKVENTLLRFTVAMSAALNPEAYREEYQKKLYKLLTKDQKDSDTIRYFADYSAGKLPRAALRSFVKQAQLERKIKRGKTGDQEMWWKVSNPPHSYGEIEVVARTREEAIEKAIGPDGYPSWARTRESIQAEALRPYEGPAQPAQGATQFGSARGAPNYAVVRVSDGEVVHRFHAADRSEALGIKHDWVQARGEGQAYYSLQAEPQSTGEFQFELSQTDIENRLGWPDQTGDANYEVVNRNTLQPVYLFIANTDQDALRKYSQIIQAMGMPEDTEDYGYRARGSVMPPVANQTAQGLTQRNYTVRDASGYAMLVQAVNPNAAMQWARENYPRQFPNIVDVVLAGSSADLQQQRAQQAALANRTLVGWSVRLPTGEEVTQFRGIGNNQGDANRIAADYLRQRGMGVSGEGFEVVPIWDDA